MKKNSPQEHLLIIRLSAMGDVAMVVPVLMLLRQKYPKLKITVLSKAFFKPIFNDIPDIHFHFADVKGKHKGILGLYKLSKELNQLGVTKIADLHSVLRSNVLCWFLNWKRINIKKVDKGRKEKKALTRPQNKIFKQLKTTHQRYADVFSQLNFPIDVSNSVFLPKKEINPKIHNLIGADTKKWIGIAPFAAHKGKMYPLDLMEEVIQKLDKTNQFKIIIFGGGNKEKQQVNAVLKNHKNTVNTIEKLTFEEELALISNLDIMVSMDSGNAHLAAMYGIKAITLWGVTHPYAGFCPIGQPKEYALLSDREKYPLIPTSVYGNKLPDDYKEIMRTITPEQVIEKILEGIEQHYTSS
ncbi:glycosyltransferase family 9 protein [Leptobacterium sp. I13]|uniref:glycosyltransferase family 9 protein n=1 Tax=Leptobacterium meishanense TaxID=3128904 RepID=UPI0030ED05A7